MKVKKNTVFACLLLALAVSLFLFSCKKEDETATSELLILTETTEAATEAVKEPESTMIVEETATEPTAKLVEETKPAEKAETGVNTDRQTDSDQNTESVHTHQWKSSVVSPTCSEKGYTLRTCKTCGETAKDSFVNATGHSWKNWETIVAPTTTSTGKSERKCSACGKAESKTLDKLPVIHSHKYTGTVTTHATCTKTGVKTFVCSCGNKYTEEIQKVSHAYKETVVKPTCTTGGYTSHICSVCNGSYVDTVVAATGHKWGSWKTTKEATETNTGTKERICSTCKAKETETIPKLVHTHKYTDTVTKPTCTTDGYTTHKCTCGDSYFDSKVSATGHAWGDWKITKEATEASAGTKERVCSTCKAKETGTIPKLAHTHKYTNTVTKPTCTMEGYTTHMCTCGDSFVDTKVSATGHSWGEWKIIQEATEADEGIKERTCSNCKTVEKGTVPKVTHEHKYTSTVTKPTCATDGFTTYKCICGNTYVDNKVAATGHQWSEWKITKEATEADEGTKERTCSTCKTVEKGTVPKAIHEHKYTSTVTDPTCTSDGYTTHSCTACGDSYVDNPTSATGHDWGDWVTIIQPTETSDGYAVRDCKTCGAKVNKTIDKQGPHEHSWEMIPGISETRHIAVCPHCDVFLCYLDDGSDPNACLLAHIDATDGLFWNHSWANSLETTVIRPTKWVCECGEEKTLES